MLKATAFAIVLAAAATGQRDQEVHHRARKADHDDQRGDREHGVQDAHESAVDEESCEARSSKRC
jgi:hypothetical protein